MCWSLSPVFVKKTERGMGYQKKYGHMKVQVLKKKKKIYGHMKVHEKKIAMLSKRIYIGREIIQKEFPSQPTQSIHMHILI